jgi:peptidyl-prolyl cis-trans isomerase C
MKQIASSLDLGTFARAGLAASAGLLGGVLLLGCPHPAQGGAVSGGGGGKVAGASIPVANSTPDADDPTPIAKVGDYVITLGDLQRRLDKQSPFVRQRYHSEEKRQEFLDNQLRFELLAQEAMRRGLHNDADVQETIKKVMVQKLTRLDFEGKVSLSDISEETMRAYYDSHLDEYNKPEMTRASVLIIAKGTDPAAAREKAKKAHQSATMEKTIGDRAHFRRLVSEFGTDVETKKTGGDLRYQSKGELTAAYGADAAEKVWVLPSINAVSDIIETADSFLIFKKTGTRKPIERGFDQVKNQIRNLLYREQRGDAFNSFVDKLRIDFAVETFPEHLKKLEIKSGPEGEGDGTFGDPGLLGPGGPGGDPHAGH